MFFSEPKKSEEICDMSPVATPYPIHPPTGSNNFPPKVFKQFLFLVYFNNINISIFMTECQCISPLLSDNKVTSRLSPLDLRTRTRQIPFSATEYWIMIVMSHHHLVTCIPEEPQVAEQGPQALQEAESQWSRGHEGRRHLLNLSILSGHLRPPPLASWVTLLNLCRCP